MKIDRVNQLTSANNLAQKQALTATAPRTAAEVPGDRIALADTTPYFDRAEGPVRLALEAKGLRLDHFPGKQIRSLSALVGKGLVSEGELESLADRLKSEPPALNALLEEKRAGFMARVAQEHGVPLEDGKGTWSVQELANVDFLLSLMPASFLAEVRNGPPLRRESDSAGYTGLYNPFSDRVTLYNGFNVADGAALEEVKRAEKSMRGTVLMEIGHAWQIRKSAPVNPGVWGVVKGILGTVWPNSDFISEWARFSGWTVQPMWSLWSLFGKRSVPNLGTGSTELKNVSFSLFGKKFKFNLTDLQFDPN